MSRFVYSGTRKYPINPAVTVWGKTTGSASFFRSAMTIDADGAPNAYDPANKKGLDFLGNAGHPAKNGKPADWWALLTDNGKP